MRKTARQWVEQSDLPKEVKVAAISNMDSRIDKPCESLDTSISGRIVWHETLQGPDYWRAVWLHILAGKNLSLCPLPPNTEVLN